MYPTLQTPVPYSLGTWTLAEAATAAQTAGATNIIEPSDENLSELLSRFELNVKAGQTPTIGEVLAAYFIAVREQAWADSIADRITERQRIKRTADAGRIVFVGA
jgi:hypothetical protein